MIHVDLKTLWCVLKVVFLRHLCFSMRFSEKTDAKAELALFVDPRVGSTYSFTVGHHPVRSILRWRSTMRAKDSVRRMRRGTRTLLCITWSGRPCVESCRPLWPWASATSSCPTIFYLRLYWRHVFFSLWFQGLSHQW